MVIQQYYPSPQLARFIKCYYIAQSDYTGYIKDVFFADGCLEVVFHQGLEFFRHGERESPAKVIGQITEPLTMTAKGKGKTFGIWFLPHAFSFFTNVPANELNDRAVPLDRIFSRDFIEATGNYLHDDNAHKLLTYVECYLLQRLQTPANPLKAQIAEFAVQYILNHKAGSNLDKLVKECNVSHRYLQKIFLEKVGFSPQYLVRIVRFQQSLHTLAFGELNSLTALAYQTGYYDQAHFIHDFKKFTGFVPSQFKPGMHPINQHFFNL